MERPILMSGPMVRAILEGRKTQTRRVVSPPPEIRLRDFGDGTAEVVWRDARGVTNTGGGGTAQDILQHEARKRCPYGSPGDTLWVKENFRLRADMDDRPPSEDWWKSGAWYDADGPSSRPSGCAGGAGRLRPSIHMPRWASRLMLRVEAVRVERLRSITEEDARAEGVDPDPHPLSAAAWGGPHRLAFGRLWDSINGARAPWASNPWVWVVTFSRVEVG